MAENINKTLEEMTGGEGVTVNISGTIDAPSWEGPVSVGPTEQFPTTSAYYDAKCVVANAIYDTILGTIDWLKVNEVDLLVGVFGGVTTGLLIGLALAGPLGWAIGMAGSLIGVIAGFMITYTFDLPDIKDALVEMHTECVEALYAANSASSAEAGFLSAVDDATQPITAVERQLLALLLCGRLLNELFDPREDTVTYVSPDPVECGSTLIVWTFPTDVQSFTFSDDSTGDYEASVAYSASTQALRVSLILTTMPYQVAAGRNISPAVSQAVGSGNAIQVDYFQVGPKPKSGIEIIAVYGDASEYSIDGGGTGPGTISLPLTVSGTLVRVDVISKHGQGGWPSEQDSVSDILEIRVV